MPKRFLTVVVKDGVVHKAMSDHPDLEQLPIVALHHGEEYESTDGDLFYLGLECLTEYHHAVKPDCLPREWRAMKEHAKDLQWPYASEKTDKIDYLEKAHPGDEVVAITPTIHLPAGFFQYENVKLFSSKYAPSTFFSMALVGIYPEGGKDATVLTLTAGTLDQIAAKGDANGKNLLHCVIDWAEENYAKGSKGSSPLSRLTAKFFSGPDMPSFAIKFDTNAIDLEFTTPILPQEELVTVPETKVVGYGSVTLRDLFAAVVSKHYSKPDAEPITHMGVPFDEDAHPMPAPGIAVFNLADPNPPKLASAAPTGYTVWVANEGAPYSHHVSYWPGSIVQAKRDALMAAANDWDVEDKDLDNLFVFGVVEGSAKIAEWDESGVCDGTLSEVNKALNDKENDIEP